MSSANSRLSSSDSGRSFGSSNGLRSEEHTSELQSRVDLVCRLLLEKKENQVHLRPEAEVVVGDGEQRHLVGVVRPGENVADPGDLARGDHVAVARTGHLDAAAARLG